MTPSDPHPATRWGVLLPTQRWTAAGTVREVAALVTAYRNVGVSEFVLMPAARDRIARYERLTAVRDTVRRAYADPPRTE